jgi:alpha-L-rhamnosidase
VTIRHAEVLEDGELGVRPLRTAAATDRYVLRGGDVETWEPSFTYHGFRYVEVDGWPAGVPGRDELTAVVVHSDMERTGWFSTSNTDLAQLYENVVWSMRGNFVSIPTDCPQRDERLSWTGDLAVFAPTATYLYDCTCMLTSWLRDLALEQLTVDVPRRAVYRAECACVGRAVVSHYEKEHGAIRDGHGRPRRRQKEAMRW